MQWLDGQRKSSPALVLGMIRRLPEGSLFAARLTALAQIEQERRKAAGEPEPDTPPDTEETRLERLTQEHVTWGQESRLIATLINRVSTGVLTLFPQNQRPDWGVEGPESWWPEEQKNKQKKTEPAAEPKLEGGLKPSRLTRHFGKMGVYG